MKNRVSGDKPDSCKPVIEYPCSWQYKIIGDSREEITRIVQEHVQEDPLQLTYSNVSRSGRYVSMNLEVTVNSDEQRLALYTKLAAHPSIKIVL